MDRQSPLAQKFVQNKIILASQSPRRLELLKLLDIPFEVIVSAVDETHPAGISIEDIPSFLADKKASAVSKNATENALVIGADTIVILENKIYEKPSTHQEAKEMLADLSGKTHEVITGVAIQTKEKSKLFSCKTSVQFHQLSTSEIDYYVEKFSPLDKAGAYACQEWIGAAAIQKFNGDYYNVVGLPLQKLYQELMNF